MPPQITKEKDKKNKIIVKNPSQLRSRQTVATILDACAKLLISEGFYSLTTDKIAHEAKVSIGSLYQFFGNKESVVQALVKKVFEEDKEYINEGMKKVANLPTENRFKTMLKLALEVKQQNAELRAKLTTIQYYVMEPSYITDTMHYYRELVLQNMPNVDDRNMSKVAYILVCCFVGLTNTLAFDNPEAINDSDYISEMSHLFFNYLNLNINEEVG